MKLVWEFEEGGKREREREREPGGRATTAEARHNHFPSLELKCREQKIKIDLLDEINDFGHVSNVNARKDFSHCAIPCF